MYPRNEFGTTQTSMWAQLRSDRSTTIDQVTYARKMDKAQGSGKPGEGTTILGHQTSTHHISFGRLADRVASDGGRALGRDGRFRGIAQSTGLRACGAEVGGIGRDGKQRKGKNGELHGESSTQQERSNPAGAIKCREPTKKDLASNTMIRLD